MRNGVRRAVASADPPPGAKGTGDLYEAYSKRVYRFCLRRLGNREDALDVVQDTFLNAHRTLQRGAAPERPLDWLFTIARNLCASHYRAKFVRRTVRLDDVAGVLVAPDPPDETALRLLAALTVLPELQRHAFVLREIRGLSYQEIAAELDVSYAAVASLLFRARRVLAASVGDKRQVANSRGTSSVAGLLASLNALLGGQAASKVAATLALAGASATLAQQPPPPTPPPLRAEITSPALTPAPPVAASQSLARLVVSARNATWATTASKPFPASTMRRAQSPAKKQADAQHAAGASASETWEPPASPNETPATAATPPTTPAETEQPTASNGATLINSSAGPPPPDSDADGEQTAPAGSDTPPLPAQAGPPSSQDEIPPGQNDNTPRLEEDPPGLARDPPGQTGTPPGQSGTRPGQDNHSSGQSGAPLGQSGAPPGQDGTPPGQSETSPGQDNHSSGQSGAPPGQDGTPPGQSETSPGQDGHSSGQSGAPPGQDGTPPGLDKPSPGQGMVDGNSDQW